MDDTSRNHKNHIFYSKIIQTLAEYELKSKILLFLSDFYTIHCYNLC